MEEKAYAKGRWSAAEGNGGWTVAGPGGIVDSVLRTGAAAKERVELLAGRDALGGK